MSKFIKLFKWLYVACVYWLHYSHNRDNSLWVFGCWGGNKFSDNAKYLFQYVKERHPEIRSVWITQNRQVKESLLRRGYEVYLANTSSAQTILKKAGVAFYTNSLNDFGSNPFLCGAKLCALFHGVGFKNELRELDNQETLKAKLKMLKHRIYDLSYTDYIFTTSEFIKEKFYKQQYNAAREHIILTGQPRNDIFFEDNGCRNCNKMILYMPTFREDEVGRKKLEYIINQIANSYAFNDLLCRYGYQLVVKPHYLTRVTRRRVLSNISIMNDKDVSDIQQLLVKVDILITDYSSVIGDYVLLNRPIVFFPYDIDLYKKFKPMANEYDIILGKTSVFTLDTLYSLLENLFKEQVDFQSVNEFINYYLNSPNLRNGGYCKNICDYMFNNLKIMKE